MVPVTTRIFKHFSHKTVGYSSLHDYFYANVGVSGELPRTDTCISLVQSTLPIALARPFVEQYVPRGTKVQSCVIIGAYKGKEYT